jgi:hypothetical protein
MASSTPLKRALAQSIPNLPDVEWGHSQKSDCPIWFLRKGIIKEKGGQICV